MGPAVLWGIALLMLIAIPAEIFLLNRILNPIQEIKGHIDQILVDGVILTGHLDGVTEMLAETKDIAQFVGITSKDYDPAPAEAFVRSFKITYPSIYDPTGKVLLAFAGELPPSAIPSTMIIDREGRLAVRVLSEVSKITLVDMINDVADGQ